MQAGGGGVGGSETVGLDGLTARSLEPEGCGFYVASDGGRAWIFGTLEAVALFDGPCKSADELDSLGAVGQQCGYVGAGDTLVIEPLNKMSGSRVSSAVIAVADTTSLLLGESSIESVQSRDSGGR